MDDSEMEKQNDVRINRSSTAAASELARSSDPQQHHGCRHASTSNAQRSPMGAQPSPGTLDTINGVRVFRNRFHPSVLQ